MGASVDFESEGLRRAIINAAFCLLDLEVPEQANVAFVDPFEPTFFSRNTSAYWEERALKPADFALGKSPTVGLAGSRSE